MSERYLERYKQRFESLEKSYKLFKLGVAKELENDLEVAGLIQTFMFCFELFWKCLKDYLEYKGYENKASRDVLRNAHQVGLIVSDLWFEILDNKNIYSHTYDDKDTHHTIEQIKTNYSKLYADLYTNLKKIYEMGD